MEEEFSIFVLSEARKLIPSDQQKYLGLSRMIKLIAFVAEDIDFDLTMGWYKFGIYPANAYSVISNQYSEEEEQNLYNLELPPDIVEYFSDEFKEIQPEVTATIKNYLPYFRMDQYSFYKWIYSQKAPEEYQNLYLDHSNFEQLIKRFAFILPIHAKHPFRLFERRLKEGYRVFRDSISSQHNNLDHIEDDFVLDLFYDYMDLFEMFMFNLKKNNFQADENSLNFLEELRGVYFSQSDDLWTLLVPYRETLKGPSAEYQTQWYERKIPGTKRIVQWKINDLKKKAIDLELLPTPEDLEKDIEKSYKKRGREKKSLREIYSLIE